jgi:hypothetical protein
MFRSRTICLIQDTSAQKAGRQSLSYDSALSVLEIIFIGTGNSTKKRIQSQIYLTGWE